MKARILVIEDNATNLELMLYLLDAFGHETVSARSGEKGLELARSTPPDLVVCDIQMPGMSGYDVVRAFKASSSLAAVPIIAVTALAMVDDRGKALEQGFDGYISKPINPETFVAEVELHLKSERRSNPIAKKHETTEALASAAQTALKDDVPSLRNRSILVLDNSRTNRELAESLLSASGYFVRCAQTIDAATAIVHSNPPDLILSDIHLAQSDGFEFIRQIKETPEYRKIKFMFISSTLWPDQDRKESLRLGADKFLHRPISPEQLLSEIASCLTDRKD
jgi:two-component system cell cycle response regulator